MNNGGSPLTEISTVSRRMAKRALDMGETRLQLLLLEVEEERDKVLLAILLAIGAFAFALLTGVAFTVLILILFWNWSPLYAMVAVTVFYGALAGLCGAGLIMLRREWHAFSGTLNQLRKDSQCLGEIIH